MISSLTGHYSVPHRTVHRTNFDPLTETDIGPRSDQPYRHGVWSDHLRSIGTTRFGPVCPDWSDEEIGGSLTRTCGRLHTRPRACRQLERDGYLARDTERLRNRVRSIVPTVFGIAWPLRTASEVRDQEVVDGLRKTQWGRELADELLDELANGRRR